MGQDLRLYVQLSDERRLGRDGVKGLDLVEDLQNLEAGCTWDLDTICNKATNHFSIASLLCFHFD